MNQPMDDEHGNPLRIVNQKPDQTRGECMISNLGKMDVLFEAKSDPSFFGVLRGKE